MLWLQVFRSKARPIYPGVKRTGTVKRYNYQEGDLWDEEARSGTSAPNNSPYPYRWRSTLDKRAI